MDLSPKSIESALNQAYRYLSYRPRTAYEVRHHLKNKGMDPDIITEVITILQEKKYLNDHDFARMFIESAERNRPKSKFALEFDLKKKGVSAAVSGPILASYRDDDLAVKAVTPRLKMWKSLEKEKFKKKLMNFLRYRGFRYDTCMTVLSRFEE